MKAKIYKGINMSLNSKEFNKLLNELYQPDGLDRPRKPKLKTHTKNHEISIESFGSEITLNVEVEIDPAEEPSYDNPGGGGSITVHKVMRDGEDITKLLTKNEMRDIQKKVEEDL